MKIAVLKTGHSQMKSSEALGNVTGEIKHWLSQSDLTFKLLEYDVQQNHVPKNVDEADAYIISGSISSIMKEEAWFWGVEDFIRRAYTANKAMYGICFGHQIIAKALGGDVQKNPNGLWKGPRKLTLTDEGKEFFKGKKSLCLDQSHFDGVHKLPLGGTLLASSDHAAIEIWTLGKNVLASQGHPEFTQEIRLEDIELEKERAPAENYKLMKDRSKKKTDGTFMAQRVADFFKAVNQ